MKCHVCGTEIAEGSSFCGSCGCPVESNESIKSQRLLTKKEFLKLPENHQIRTNIKSAAIICYICAAITVIFSLVINGGYFDAFDMIDPVILIGLGLFIQLRNSIVASVILLIYSVVNVIYMTVQTGRVAGWYVCIAGVYGVIYTIKAASAYKIYRNSYPNRS